MKIYIDVDDTLGDFREHCVARGVPRWEGSWYTTSKATWADEQHAIQAAANAEMEKEDFWLTMPLAPRAMEIVYGAGELVGEKNVFLLTALPAGVNPTLWPRIREHKVRWSWHELLFPTNRIIVCPRHDKARYAVDLHIERQNLLIDDAEQNCEEWIAASGLAHHHTDPEGTLAFLNTF